MKQTRMTVSTFLLAFLTAALVAFSCLMCLVDAFYLPSSPLVLLAGSCGIAAVGAGAMWFRRTGLFSAALGVVLLALIFWFRSPVTASLWSLLHAISVQYSLAYSAFPVFGEEGGDPTIFLLLLAVPLAWLTAWVTAREGSALLVLLACMPVLLLCLILVDLAPVLWLILLTGVLLLLLLSQSVRTRNPAEGSRLAWWLVLPTMILVAAITVLWPPAAYERAAWSNTLQALAESKVSFPSRDAETAPSVSTPAWNSSLQTVDLSQVGPRVTTGQEVLQYRSSNMIFYLRGVSLGIYADNAWSAVPQQEFLLQRFAENPQISATDGNESLELQVSSLEPMLFTTYFLPSIPADGEAVDDAYISNSDQLYYYQMSYGRVSRTTADYDAYVSDHYVQVPETLLPALLEIAGQAGLTESSTPQQIAAYVQSSAVYDRDTPRVPAGEDFVLYFLQQSQRGYCVHFASATVLLLRALQIPARYVTGYAVSGQPNQWNSVTDENAHAWVEYYVDGIGWLPLDPTPAESQTTSEPDSEEVTTSPDSEPIQTPDADADTDADTQESPEYSTNSDPSEDSPGTKPQTQPLDETPEAVPSGDSNVMTRSRPSGKWLWLLAVPALAGLTVLRRRLVLQRRKDRCHHGYPNRRALTLWRWLVRLSKADGNPPAEDLLSLAEKARFSQHKLTEAELSQLQTALDAKIQALQAVSPVKRLWYRYGIVLF